MLRIPCSACVCKGYVLGIMETKSAHQIIIRERQFKFLEHMIKKYVFANYAHPENIKGNIARFFLNNLFSVSLTLCTHWRVIGFIALLGVT